MKHDQTQGFRIIKLGQVKNPRCPPLPKIAKKQQNNAWNNGGTLVFKIVKIKNSTAELIHCDLFGVYNSSFAHLPISQKN